jgi:hypothetical protein
MPRKCLAIEGKQKAYTQCLTTRKQASRNAFFSWIADDDKGKYNPKKMKCIKIMKVSAWLCTIKILSFVRKQTCNAQNICKSHTS